jgi:VCBS repeat protein
MRLLCASLLGVALAAGLAGASTRVQAPSFSALRVYTASEDAGALTIADLNGDGKPDLAVANMFSDSEVPGTVSIRLNRGDGTFRPRRDYGTPLDPEAIAAGDLNGDGKADLVTGQVDDESISVLLNTGAASFRERRDYNVGAEVEGVATADVNGDGKADVVAVSSPASSAYVFLNAGDGSLLPPADYLAGTHPNSVAVGDLNGDGKPDLVTPNGDTQGSVAVLLNNGDGTFGTPRHTGSWRGTSAVAIADVNGDGKPDVLAPHAAGYRSAVGVLLNRGDGTFTAGGSYAVERGSASDPAVGDFNGDGKPDVATLAGGLSRLSLLLNRGDGTFGPALSYPGGGGDVGGGFDAADLNGDGTPDLVAASAPYDVGQVEVSLSTSTRCNVQDVRRITLAAAKTLLQLAHCGLGRVRSQHSAVKAGRVFSQRPGFGRVLPAGTKVGLVVSTGPRR